MPLAQVLQIEGGAPAPLVAFLARQLGLSPSALADYATRTQTMTDHARLVAVNRRPKETPFVEQRDGITGAPFALVVA